MSHGASGEQRNIWREEASRSLHPEAVQAGQSKGRWIAGGHDETSHQQQAVRGN